MHPPVPTAYADSVNPSKALPTPASFSSMSSSSEPPQQGGSVVRRKSMLPHNPNTQRALEEYQVHHLQ